ncbi:UDP-galactopyranose mutase [Gluconacetobacter liquefaciens]|uniref:UDP-galactopyranose mutase n=1 Tax=Gluconacetobacter liquefaciens TaxID=89584 RepID=A0A370G980_GLULI|nr:UDP-galactopyranose mutase [Gluconacetobacter liquefaciens]MBB2185954.1 UDP-galactopyranose mutase [Gluconacetobacter liquefaciens]RDI39770.1 UDP-galactopyranose mutase [Gluconacetobacter liquefaciens]GBR11393.1 UDP-galactopyranose mutase [Gluconacetobacter liquefaciens NRIC 0522]GEB37632.1 UDP-galactopyranose mutase [Gluconacetobacter liquefaciens]
MKFCVVGAGFSGAVIARHLAEAGHTVLVVDERPHVGGNCHTERDAETGVMVHSYGPHIFHTADTRVWQYVQRFGVFRPYTNRVKAVSGGHVYSLPVNLLTINQFFGRCMGPKAARAFIDAKADKSIIQPASFEEQALGMIGPELYRAFFYGYTRKQWGIDPADLPASILKRLPLRFDYNDNYFNHPYQGMPEDGYTAVIKNILDVNGMEIRMNCSFEDCSDDFDHVFYTGPIDRYFNFRIGRLAYRTLDFERFVEEGDYQGSAVINYCDESVPYTRITEHKYFAPWEKEQFSKTVCFREYSRLAQKGDIPYYPVRLVNDEALINDYIGMAREEKKISFLGRLGTYRYLDMDVTIKEALHACDVIDHALHSPEFMLPAFFVPPH